VKAQKKLRIAEFKQRAGNMGITQDELVSQKVAIWEGMWAAEQNGEDIKVSIIYSTLSLKLWSEYC